MKVDYMHIEPCLSVSFTGNKRLVIVPYFRPTINDVSYVSIVTGSSLLEALRSYCCQSSVSILVGAGSQN